jgi:hypothetical protein
MCGAGMIKIIRCHLAHFKPELNHLGCCNIPVRQDRITHAKFPTTLQSARTKYDVTRSWRGMIWRVQTEQPGNRLLRLQDSSLVEISTYY